MPLKKSKSFIPQGSKGIIVEELVNFAESTGNAALWLREKGYKVENAATILTYDNPNAIQRLKEMQVKLHYLFTLSKLLDIGEKYKFAKPHLIQEYRDFLENPLEWQKKRGLEPVKGGGTI